jgi:acetyl-CoA carboxylase carboxyl transferase subunit alpha
MIPEPPGGAHLDPSVVYKGVKKFIAEQWDFFKYIPIDILLEQRYQKFRKLGKFAVEEKTDLV